MKRNSGTDKAIEMMFGKPDYSRSWLDPETSCIYTPFKKVKLWRIDTEETYAKLKGGADVDGAGNVPHLELSWGFHRASKG